MILWLFSFLFVQYVFSQVAEVSEEERLATINFQCEHEFNFGYYAQCEFGLLNFRPYLKFMDDNEVEYDDAVPRPSISMVDIAEGIVTMFQGKTEQEFLDFDFSSIRSIDELGQLEDELIYFSETYGLPMFKILLNYSESIPDIMYLNFGTTSRILRFNKRFIQQSNELRENVGYIGILFSSIKQLNSKSKLVPTVNSVLNTVEFNTAEFFNMTDIMHTLEKIDQVSS